VLALERERVSENELRIEQSDEGISSDLQTIDEFIERRLTELSEKRGGERIPTKSTADVLDDAVLSQADAFEASTDKSDEISEESFSDQDESSLNDESEQNSTFQADNESTSASTQGYKLKTREIYGMTPETEQLYRDTINESLIPSNCGTWKDVRSNKPYVHLRSCRKPGQSQFYMHLVMEIAAPITDCMSIGYEQDIFTIWNPIVVKNALLFRV
jgi:hypothetical protein